MLVEPVRRRFQRQMRDALARQSIERAMQFDRIGRGQRAVSFALGRYDADGADARRLQSQRRPDLARESGNRGLAAGGGHAGDLDAGETRIDFGFRQEIAQLHRVSFALTSSIWSALGRSKRGLMSRSGATRAITLAPTGTAFQPDVAKPCVSGSPFGSSIMINNK